VTEQPDSDARWRRVGEIFASALDQPASRLDAILAEACAGDSALEAEVRSLLESHRAAGEFLEPGAASLAIARVPLPEAQPLEGRVLGPWRVVRSIGEGGMGTVYLAEREEGGFRQRGALKLIRHGLASEEMIRRFRRERQILASLDHPGIARLLDGGTTPDGLPWLVMEHVEGRSLYEWCTEKSVALVERLRLFLSICASVQAAHQRLVLHRDIKPGNILVTEDGTPRLLDFGVAKILSPDSDPEAQDLRTVALPLTPEYASPEQLRGEAATTASDIYSLGVLLYELVTGARPYPTRAGGTHDLIRSVLESDPPRPSTAVAGTVRASVAKEEARSETVAASAGAHRTTLPAPPSGSVEALRRRLSGDLDNIVLKAINKEPTRRYVSVAHVAEDIRAFLDGRPVSALAATWSYRTGKFVRRNRLAVGAGVLAILTLVAGLVATSWQAAIAQRERAAAERRLREIQSMANALLFDVHDSLAAVPGTTPIREMVVAKATEYLDRLAADAGPDSAVRFGLGDAYARLGLLQGQVWQANVGKADEAYESFKKSQGIRESLLQEYPNHPRAIHGVLQISTRIGLFDLEHAREPEALSMLERALACARRLIELFPDSSSYRADLPKRLNNVGLALMNNDRVTEGLTVVSEAIRACEENARREPDVPAHRRFLAHCAGTLVEGLLLVPGMADSAIAVTRRTIAIHEGLLREDPSDVDAKRHVGSGFFDLARIYSLSVDRSDSAIANAQRATEMLREMAESDPGNQDLLVTVAIGESGEGMLRAMAGETADAEGLLRRAAANFESWLREDSTDARFLLQLHDAYLGLGFVEINRAREERGGATSRARWVAARAWLDRARAVFARFVAGGGDQLSSADAERIARAHAACDSALALR